MDISIIIVNYNTCDLTLQAINSVYNSKTSYHFEVFVVDNASVDNSVNLIKEKFPQVKLIENKENLGFSKANNQAIKLAKGKYVLLLNSDTIINTDTLEIMTNLMNDDSKIGASGCKVVLPSGKLDKACKRGFPTPSASLSYFLGLSRLFPKKAAFNQYQLGHLDENEEYEVDCLVGAFMLVRKKTINQVGMLDEDFFMYGEDIDWCYRIKNAGWKIYYYPETSITHYKGASSKKKPTKIIYEFHRAMVLFHQKNFKQKYFFTTNFIIYLGIWGKFLVEYIRNQVRIS
ncbi:glycosyl transferase [Bacillus sp. TS-2]|nr:glycosyl transferase [Bacillus sp. TS-2]